MLSHYGTSEGAVFIAFRVGRTMLTFVTATIVAGDWLALIVTSNFLFGEA